MMDLLSSIELPHWLMIAGVVLIAMGLLGRGFTRKGEAAKGPDPEPPPHPKMPPLPTLLDSSRRKGKGK
jgi:hypothetical protein